MTRYISQEGNLKMMMNMLRDKSKNIQFEAFHVFKVGLQERFFSSVPLYWLSFPRQVFVANPKKPPQIEAILRRNREKLLTFLRGFHNDKEDEQFSVSNHQTLTLLSLFLIYFTLGREAIPHCTNTEPVTLDVHTHIPLFTYFLLAMCLPQHPYHFL